jgi:hypothetical protein
MLHAARYMLHAKLGDEIKFLRDFKSPGRLTAKVNIENQGGRYNFR